VSGEFEPEKHAEKRLKLLVVPAISFLVVAAVIAFSIHRVTRDECYDWEEQFDQLDESFSRYLSVDGDQRTAALAELSSLELPCAKVAESRDVCVVAYRHLLLAEEEHLRAKAALPRVRRAHASHEPRLREVARRCILQDQPEGGAARELGLEPDERQHLDEAIASLEPSLRDVAEACVFRDQPRDAIAQELDVDTEVVKRRVSAAMKSLGLGEMADLHREVEQALERSNKHLADAETTNSRCDELFKQLQTERHR